MNSIYSPLPMLAHRNELLVWVAVAVYAWLIFVVLMYVHVFHVVHIVDVSNLIIIFGVVAARILLVVAAYLAAWRVEFEWAIFWSPVSIHE